MGGLKRLIGVTAGVAIGTHIAPYALTLNCYALSEYSQGLMSWPQLFGIGRPDHVALTFDDGPDAGSTPQILDVLDELNWKATFFMLGEMTRRNPAVAKEVVDRGHEVGAHGYAHESFMLMHPKAATENVKRSKEAVESATGVEVTRFRPPFGTLSASAFAASYTCELDPVLWSAWGWDWQRETTPVQITEKVTRGVLEGGTLLLHDSDCTSAPNGVKATMGALPLIAEAFAERNLTAGPLRDHFAVSAPD